MASARYHIAQAVSPCRTVWDDNDGFAASMTGIERKACVNHSTQARQLMYHSYGLIGPV
jgi:hypothetical protein